MRNEIILLNNIKIDINVIDKVYIHNILKYIILNEIFYKIKLVFDDLDKCYYECYPIISDYELSAVIKTYDKMLKKC